MFLVRAEAQVQVPSQFDAESGRHAEGLGGDDDVHALLAVCVREAHQREAMAVGRGHLQILGRAPEGDACQGEPAGVAADRELGPTHQIRECRRRQGNSSIFHRLAAHDALSDVYATIALARLIRDRQPRQLYQAGTVTARR